MRIESENKESYITMDYIDCETERYPTVCVFITVKNEDFVGINKEVWFELDLLKQFTDTLKELDYKRKGFASIKSMSPDEFSLSVETYDLSGHLMLKYNICKLGYCPNVSKSLSGGFGLDSTLFTKIVNDFVKLGDSSKYPPPEYPYIDNV